MCKNVVWNLEFYTEHLSNGINGVESIPSLLQKYFREITASGLLTFSTISEKSRSDLGSSPLPLDSSGAWSNSSVTENKKDNTEDTCIATLKTVMHKNPFYFIS